MIQDSHEEVGNSRNLCREFKKQKQDRLLIYHERPSGMVIPTDVFRKYFPSEGTLRLEKSEQVFGNRGRWIPVSAAFRIIGTPRIVVTSPHFSVRLPRRTEKCGLGTEESSMRGTGPAGGAHVHRVTAVEAGSSSRHGRSSATPRRRA